MKTAVYIATPLVAWVVAQGIKILISLRFDGIQLRDAIQSGGMPSSHAAFMAALTTILGLGEGFDTAVFALSLGITAVVCYDALSVRRATGQQTAAIYELARKTKTKLDQQIVEARGHSWPQVLMGLSLGFMTAAIMSLQLS